MAATGSGRVAAWAALLGCWVLSRALLVAVGLTELPFYPQGPRAFDDLSVYARWLPDLANGQIPIDDMWQYPPFSGLLFMVGDLGADPVRTLLAALVLVDLALTVVLARHRLAAGWWWVGFGLAIGPVLVSRFDVVPTLFAVLAVLAATRPVQVGIWSAIGAGLKLWPVLVLPIVPRRAAVRAGAGFVATTAVLLAAASVAFADLSGFLTGQGSRGLQVESLGALPFLIANAVVGGVPIEYRYGSMEVAAGGAGIAAGIVTVLLLAGLGWVAIAWARGRFESLPAGDVAFTVVLFSVVVSRVFSPQYSIWLLGLGTLCLVDPASRLRAPVLLVALAAVITQILYPAGYGWLLAGEPRFVALQALRLTLVTVALGWSWYLVMIARVPDQARDLAPVSPR